MAVRVQQAGGHDGRPRRQAAGGLPRQTSRLHEEVSGRRGRAAGFGTDTRSQSDDVIHEARRRSNSRQEEAAKLKVAELTKKAEEERKKNEAAQKAAAAKEAADKAAAAKAAADKTKTGAKTTPGGTINIAPPGPTGSTPPPAPLNKR